jgi:preprotein translocase subunit SecD
MLTRFHCFNIYLFTTLLLLPVLNGCRSTPEEMAEKEKKKYRAVVRVHLEAPRVNDGFSIQAPIFRESPILLPVTRDPVLYERDVTSASIVEEHGGFAIRIEFNEHGKLVLESITTGNRGRRLAIQSVWKESRWLGAPVIAERITDGVIKFTPDATREEAERIVHGLNNVVKAMKREERFLLF